MAIITLTTVPMIKIFIGRIYKDLSIEDSTIALLFISKVMPLLDQFKSSLEENGITKEQLNLVNSEDFLASNSVRNIFKVLFTEMAKEPNKYLLFLET